MISEGVAHLQILTDADANILTHTQYEVIWSNLSRVREFQTDMI